MLSSDTTANRQPRLSPLLIFELTFIIGYVVWLSTPGYLLLLTLFPQIILRGIYYIMGRALVIQSLENKHYLPALIVQLLYLLVSFSIEDGDDVHCGVFFGLMHLPPSISGQTSHLCLLLFAILIGCNLFNLIKTRSQTSLKPSSTIKINLPLSILKGFVFYPLLSIALCILMYFAGLIMMNAVSILQVLI